MKIADQMQVDDFRPSVDVSEKELQSLLDAYQQLRETGLIPKPISFEDPGKTAFVFHVPKTGGSLFNVIAKRACPRLPKEMMNQCLGEGIFMMPENSNYLSSVYCDVNVPVHGHRALDEENVTRAFGMFRSPVNLTVSAYHYLMQTDVWDWSGMKDAEIEEIKKSASPFRTFSENLHAISWQTKMLSGMSPLWEMTPDYQQTQLAVERLERMKFVGLTDQWTLTLFLFSAMFGGRDLTPVDFGNIRNTQYDDAAYHDAIKQIDSPTFDWVHKQDHKIFKVFRMYSQSDYNNGLVQHATK